MAIADTSEITLEELQLSGRNHSIPLEALKHDITPIGLHYLLIHFDIPKVDAETWQLEVGGLVEKPLALTLADVKARPGADDAGDSRMRGQRTGAHRAAADEPAVARGRRRHGRVDGHAARAAPRGGRPRRGGEGDRLQRARPRASRATSSTPTSGASPSPRRSATRSSSPTRSTGSRFLRSTASRFA